MNKETCEICTHTHTLDYHSAIKKNELLPFGTTRMDLEGIMLSANFSHKYLNLRNSLSANMSDVELGKYDDFNYKAWF